MWVLKYGFCKKLLRYKIHILSRTNLCWLLLWVLPCSELKKNIYFIDWFCDICQEEFPKVLERINYCRHSMLRRELKKSTGTVPNNSFSFWPVFVHKWLFLGFGWPPWILIPIPCPPSILTNFPWAKYSNFFIMEYLKFTKLFNILANLHSIKVRVSQGIS